MDNLYNSFRGLADSMYGNMAASDRREILRMSSESLGLREREDAKECNKPSIPSAGDGGFASMYSKLFNLMENPTY